MLAYRWQSIKEVIRKLRDTDMIEQIYYVRPEDSFTDYGSSEGLEDNFFTKAIKNVLMRGALELLQRSGVAVHQSPGG